ncbi:hypothetical protein Tco_1430041 [Tanacetum coccineum]
MFNINERVYNPQSQIQNVSHQVSMFHPQASQVINPQPSMIHLQASQVINPQPSMFHPQASQVINPQPSMIHSQASQVIHQQASQAPVVSLQSSADPIQVDSSLVAPYFLPTDDPLECLTKALTFMSTILASTYPSSNNQLETSSNPMHQVAMLERQTLSYEAGIQLSKDQLAILADTRKRIYFGPGAFTVTTNALFQADGVEVYDSDCDDNAQPSFMVNISSYGSDALAEVHNPDNVDNNMINQAVQAMPPSEQSNVVNHSETEITSDSNIIPYSHQVINCTKINLDNKSVNDSLTAELERYKEQVKVLKEGQNVDLKSKDNVSDSCEQSVEIDCFQNPFYLKKAQQLEPKLYDGNVIKNTSAIVIPDSEETLMLAEESRSKMLLKQQDPMMLEKKVNTTPVDYAALNQLSQDFETRFVPQTELSAEQAFWSQNSMNSSEPTSSCRPTKVEVPKELPKVSMVNTSLKKLKHHLAGFDVVVKERTTTTAITEGTWGFEHTKACFRDEIIPFVKALKDLFNTFDQYLIDELSEVQNVFHQMEQAVEQHRLESKTFQVKMNKVLNENERLLEQVISKDIVNIIVNSYVDNDYVNVRECEKCLKLETELLNKKDFIEKETYDKLFKRFTTLEKHCISLEVNTQLNQEIFQRDNSVSNQGALSFDQYFEINELKAQSQEKDKVIIKLKERIKSLSGKMNEDKIKKDLEEIETINIEVDHRVSKLIAENKHLKQTYKQPYDSIKPTRVRSKEQCDALVNQVNQKSVEISDLNAQLQEKVDLEPLSPKLKNNREAHVDYIRITKENADTLCDIVEQARTSNPLENVLAYACMYTKQIQELLVYVSDTCPSSPLKSEKLVAVTPMNKSRKVTFAKTSTTSDNNTQIQVDVH